MNLAEFDGDDFLGSPLETSQKSRKKPGRPPTIPDDQLRHAQTELLFLMEEHWALVGWDLQQASTASQVRAAFRKIRGSRSTMLELLCEQRAEPCKQPDLKAARTCLAAAAKTLRDVQLHRECCTEKNERIRAALKSCQDGPVPAEMASIATDAEVALAAANEELKTAQTKWLEADSKVREAESSLAQFEVLDFIQSQRYELTPLHFASALAGLPHIRWRQSITRCQGFQDTAAHGLAYRSFQILAEVFTTPCTDAQEAVERMKTRLMKATGQDVKPLHPLAENWYFLKAAIEQVSTIHPKPVGALPYRILAEYKRRSENPSPTDRIFAPDQRISTQAFVKEQAQAGEPLGSKNPMGREFPD